MLEIRNLTKIYKSKGGVIVKALDGVSIKFPSKGLVFLLGKSGSGKSTLLNVTGGLDKPDDGEIIIKGRNSKSFSSSDFDSYRNTFIGFIFQEYNILNEFNVEQNISLALQLQGKKNDKQAVDKILEAVDLSGYGKRKPNTLSGGQKQRIAIARALIKNPEIIMADEPTGALDSNTGKQVFDTLKKLSLEKLIIVVSHDRDFAEYYGDRIIELSDGKIISDVTKETVLAKQISNHIEVINDNVISIKNAKDMTKEEFIGLYDLLHEEDGEVIISKGEKQIPLIKQISHIRSDNKSEVFKDTSDIKLEEYDASKTKFIKSRLPMARAFKMGASSLKTKPIRMIFTIFLTLVALTMFGVASTLLLYDPNYSLASGLENSSNDYETIYKEYEIECGSDVYNNNTLEKKENSYHYTTTSQGRISQNEINELNNNSLGHHFIGIFGFSDRAINLEKRMQSDSFYCMNGFNGFVDAKMDELSKSGISLYLGTSPKNKDEIAISLFAADALIQANEDITSYSDIIDHEFQLSFYTKESINEKFKIVGIYNTGNIPDKFQELKTKENFELETEYKSYLKYSYHVFAYVYDGFYEDYKFVSDSMSSMPTTSGRGLRYTMMNAEKANYDEWFNFTASEFLDDNAKNNFYNLNGEAMEYKAPIDNEIYVTYSEYRRWRDGNEYSLIDRIDRMTREPNYSDVFNSYYEKNVERITNILSNINTYRINGYSDYQADLAYLEEVNNTYYLAWFNHHYLADKLFLIFEQIKDEGRQSEVPNFTDLEDALREYYDGYSTRNDNEFKSSIYDVYMANKDYYDMILKRYYVKYISRYIISENDNGWYDQIPQEVVMNNYSIALEYLNGNEISNQDFNNLIQIGKEYLESKRYDVYSDFTIEALEDQEYRINYSYDFEYYLAAPTKVYPLKVLGYVDSYNNVLSIKYVKDKGTLEEETSVNYTISNYKDSLDAKYDHVITRTNYSEDQIRQLLQKADTYYYEMTNMIYLKVSMIVDIINTMQKVFLIIGIV
ncbi:MAG: ATP-binding cassette domain-containing protein, partial [Acholeplasmatales bacterium]|nr:ATP-binding cassette domain-containing protein [Acholeplasmatales bacterium]